jgi:hypothetical protein
VVDAGLGLEAVGAGVVAVGAADGTAERVLPPEGEGDLVARFAGGDDVTERVRAGTAGLWLAG